MSKLPFSSSYFSPDSAERTNRAASASRELQIERQELHSSSKLSPSPLLPATSSSSSSRYLAVLHLPAVRPAETTHAN